jgi:LuxR family maltose regulon positive regulatory protein
METDDRLVDTYQVRLWLAQRNLEAAKRWAEERGLTGDIGHDELGAQVAKLSMPIFRVMEYLTLAEVYLAQGRPGHALQVLEPLLQATETAGWTGFVLRSLVFKALALQAQGETPKAIRALERALLLAEPGGFVRVFVDEGQPMVRLLRQAARRDIATGYVARLLAALEDETRHHRPRAQEAGSSSVIPGGLLSLVEPLSEREMEVLRLIAAGLSNREIADTLVIALSTVKTHVNNIYRKLDVSKRTQAVARARDLNLL